MRALADAAHGLGSGDWQDLEHEFSSWGSWAQLLCDMRDPLGPGTKPMSPASVGGFLTTGSPGNPTLLFI